MVSMAWAPFTMVVWLLLFAGVVLALRGLIGAVATLRLALRCEDWDRSIRSASRPANELPPSPSPP